MPRNATRRAPARSVPAAPRPALTGRRGAVVAPPALPVSTRGVSDEALLKMLGENPDPAAVNLARAIQKRIDRPRTAGGAVSKGDKRKDKDFYETPPATCDAIVARLEQILPTMGERAAAAHTCDADAIDGRCTFPNCGDVRVRPFRIVEPSAGSGNFVSALRRSARFRDAKVIAVDLLQSHALSLHRAGATSYIVGRWQEQDLSGFDADLHIGNRPFSEAEEHIEHSLSMLRDGAFVADLLPVTFLASQGRCERLWSKPGLRYYASIAERPSYTGNGKTMQTEYGLYVWQKGYASRAEILDPIWRA